MGELTIESITTEVQTAEGLSDEQKQFLTANADKLTPEVADKYGIEKPPLIAQPPVLPQETPEQKAAREAAAATEATEEEKKIAALVDKRIEGLTGVSKETAIIVKVDSFLNQNAGLVDNINVYREAMIGFAKHPNYSGLSAKELFSIVAADELQRIGARKERVAAEKARATQTNTSGGHKPSGNDGKKIDWHTASTEDFHKKRQEVLQRRGL